MAQSTITPQFSNEFLGQYAVSMLTGTMAAGIAGAASICHIRNATASRLLAVQKVSVTMASLGTGFTKGTGIFGLIMGRGVTAASASGAAIDLTPNNKLDATYADSLSDGLFRIATTAAMTAGSGQTLDNNALVRIFTDVTTAVDTVFLSNGVLFDSTGDRAQPIIVRNGEVLHVSVTQPATGTWQAVVNVIWSEVSMAGRTGTVGA